MNLRLWLFGALLCSALRADPNLWTAGDPSPEEQAALWWLNRVRADPAGTLQSLIAAAPGDPVLTACFAAQTPRTPAQLLASLQAAVALAQSNAAAFPRSAALCSAPLAGFPRFQADAEARATAAVWPALSYPPGRSPPAFNPAVPMSSSLVPDADGHPESVTLGDLYAAAMGPREWVLSWLFTPGSGSPPPGFLVQGDALPDLTLGHARLAGLGVSAAAGDGGRTLCLTRSDVEFLKDGELPFGASGTVFITGVVYRDRNGNGCYDAGEGLAGVPISLDHGAWGAVTGAAGGFAIPVPINSGDYEVSAGGNGLPAFSTRVTVAGDNVGCDWVLPASPPDRPPQTTVAPADGNAALVNVSARGQVEGGAGALTAGFVIQGPPGSAKRVLIRGVGPSLQSAGVPATQCVPATALQVFAGATVVAANSGWTQTADGGAAARAAAVQCGAFPLTAWAGGGGDSALVLLLPPGTYSAVVTPAAGAPVSDTVGHIGLAEVYDLSPGDGSQIVNLSARGLVGPDTAAMIIGAAVAGTGHARVLVRAAGPALAAFGVQPTLPDPQLTLFSAGGAPLQSNDNWGESAQTDQIAALAATAGAFPFAAGSADAALVVRLPPGTVTAQAVAAPGSAPSGIALVELYLAP